MKPWTFAEVEYLKVRLSLGDAIKDIATVLDGRSESAIRTKAIAKGWLQVDETPRTTEHRAFVARNMAAARDFRERMRAAWEGQAA